MPLVNEAESREKLAKKFRVMSIELGDEYTKYLWAYTKTDMSEYIKKRILATKLELGTLIRLLETENARLADKNDCGD